MLLARAYVAFVDEMRAALAERGFDNLHGSFGYVARFLAARDRTLRELADALQMTSPGALKIIQDMEDHGYLQRAGDPDDRRVVRLGLTVRGRAALAAARHFHADFEARLGERLGARVAAQMRATLAEIVRERELDGVPVPLRPV